MGWNWSRKGVVWRWVTDNMVMCNIEHLPKPCAIWMCENMDEKYKRSFVTWQCLCRGHCFFFPRTLLLLQQKLWILLHKSVLHPIIHHFKQHVQRRKRESRETKLNPTNVWSFHIYTSQMIPINVAQCQSSQGAIREANFYPTLMMSILLFLSDRLFTNKYPRERWHFATLICTQMCLSPLTRALLCY